MHSFVEYCTMKILVRVVKQALFLFLFIICQKFLEVVLNSIICLLFCILTFPLSVN